MVQGTGCRVQGRREERGTAAVRVRGGGGAWSPCTVGPRAPRGGCRVQGAGFGGASLVALYCRGSRAPRRPMTRRAVSCVASSPSRESREMSVGRSPAERSYGDGSSTADPRQETSRSSAASAACRRSGVEARRMACQAAATCDPGLVSRRVTWAPGLVSRRVAWGPGLVSTRVARGSGLVGSITVPWREEEREEVHLTGLITQLN